MHIAIEIALHKHQMEKRLRESQEWFSTTLRSIGDAVIATDRNGLVTFMNQVAESLTGWKLEEALNKKLTEVFKIINRDTRQPVQNPVARVILEGKVVGLANHTKLIAKDGTEIPIDDSAAPIKDDRDDLVGVVLTFRDVTEREKAEEELRRHREHLEQLVAAGTLELRDLAHRLVNAQEQERARIGHALHDEIGQLLTCATYLIETAVRKPDKQILAEARSTIQEAISKIRDLSSMLSPRLLRSSGLLPALVSLAEDYERRTNIKVDFDHSDGLEEIPENLALTAYRIVQEALTNIARHAKTSEAKVQLLREPGKLRLEVIDNGIGFDRETVKHSAGLIGMRERALALDGELTIESNHGQGTRLVGEFPFSRTEKA